MGKQTEGGAVMSINIGGGELKELKPRILVLGVGGAGGNAINAMIEAGMEGVLKKVKVIKFLQLYVFIKLRKQNRQERKGFCACYI